jgi:hypothetical protein
VARGDVAGVKKAVEQGAKVNQLVSGYAPLHIALLATSDPYWHPYGEGVYSIVTYLLSKGANPNIPFPTKDNIQSVGLTPLHYVAYDGRTELVYRMIKAGANVSAVTKERRTPLHQAAGCDFRWGTGCGSSNQLATSTVDCDQKTACRCVRHAAVHPSKHPRQPFLEVEAVYTPTRRVQPTSHMCLHQDP